MLVKGLDINTCEVDEKGEMEDTLLTRVLFDVLPDMNRYFNEEEAGKGFSFTIIWRGSFLSFWKTGTTFNSKTGGTARSCWDSFIFAVFGGDCQNAGGRGGARRRRLFRRRDGVPF